MWQIVIEKKCFQVDSKFIVTLTSLKHISQKRIEIQNVKKSGILPVRRSIKVAPQGDHCDNLITVKNIFKVS